LHQQRCTLATEPSACRKCYTLFLGGEDYISDFSVGPAAINQTRMPGIGHIADLSNAATFECLE
jgi:hypothetical protein